MMSCICEMTVLASSYNNCGKRQDYMTFLLNNGTRCSLYEYYMPLIESSKANINSITCTED